MSNPHIAIGIQARSSSTRLPGKVHKILSDKSILEHVVKSCRDAAAYLSNLGRKRVSIYLLTPYNDEIRELDLGVQVLEGPEDDVLRRYVLMGEKTKADFICRITADCPLIPNFVISKIITIAVMNKYDYVSNVDERCRTSPDGVDCEVLSYRLLKYLDINAKDPKDREHVTTLVRRNPPAWIHQGTVINFMDRSRDKFSVDTLEDLDRVRNELHQVETKYAEAVKIFGKQSVHRF